MKSIRQNHSFRNSRPNVILIVLDALRADRVSCYGYERNTTPTIDQIAKEGVVFRQAISTAPWTLPAHASLFTGLYTTEHGAMQEHPFLDSEIPTLPEILKKLGYRTAGFSNNPWVGSVSGLDRGFDLFMEWKSFRPPTAYLFKDKVIAKISHWLGREHGKKRMAEKTVEQIVAWLQGYIRENTGIPFFLFANFVEPHLPYSPPTEFVEKFVPVNLDFDVQKINQDDNRYITGLVEMTARDFKYLGALYDGEVAYLDNQLGVFLSHLKKLEILDDTLLIITSDHGENIGDHGLMSHELCLYDTLLRVPLIIRYPNRFPTGEVICSQVQTLGIFSTILHLVQASSDEHCFKCEKSLLARVSDRSGGRQEEFAYAEYFNPVMTAKRLRKYAPDFNDPRLDTSLKCVRTPEFKYIWSERGQDEFYDLRVDPGETRNLVDQCPHALLNQLNEMKAILDEWRHSLTVAQAIKGPLSETIEETEDKEVLERLRELGYIA